MLRRNGKPSSCEPCRRSKLKCDNVAPVCQRCIKRKLKDSCFYHPAPLTQTRKPVDRTLRQIRPSIPTPPASACPVADGSYSAFSPASTHRPHQCSSQSSPQGITVSTTDKPLRVHDCMIGADVVRRLESIEIFELLCQEYYSIPRTCALIKDICLNTVSAIRRDVEGDWKTKSRHEIALKISENTRKPLHIPASCKALEVHELFTGPNLRWEAVGLIFAVAGLFIYLIPQKATALILGKSFSFEGFSEAMEDVGKHCLLLFQERGVPNDLSLWFLYMDSLHLANLHGDSDPVLWRRMGEVSTDIFILGFHQELEDLTSVPFWLNEQRKRMLAAAYKSDKLLASFLNRPPRIPRQFCSLRPPLDLSDDEVVQEEPALGAAVARLDENGWSTDGRPNAASWQRLKLTMSLFREELLEMSFQSPNQEDLSERLKTMAENLRTTWENSPVKLKITINKATPRYPQYTYLDYLHCAFAIERLLCRSTGSSTTLVRCSRDLLDQALGFARHGYMADDWELSRDMPWFLLYFGLPAAGVLCAELRKHTQTGTPLPSFVSRTDVIRNLYVFVSTLGWFGSDEFRYAEMCAAASKKLSDEIDEVINAAMGSLTSQPQPAFGKEQDLQTLEQDALEQHASQSLDADVSFLTWLDSVDWNTTMPTF